MKSELPGKQHYGHQFRPLLAVDCIIFGFDQDALKLLLIKRDFEPEKGRWSLVGGFLKEGETLDGAADRVLYNLTGLRGVFLEQLHTFSQLDRDPVERTVSVAYYALINMQGHSGSITRQHAAQWFGLQDLPPLIFDHGTMVQAAVARLRQKANTRPIGFELLPQRFTMRSLQKLYEAIMDEPFDKRNFTKKINQLDILRKLDEKDMSSSKKGAYLYCFDEQKYRKRVGKGFLIRPDKVGNVKP